jgi:hypothetical protein
MTLQRTLLLAAWCALVCTVAGCDGSNSSATSSSSATNSVTMPAPLTSSSGSSSPPGSSTPEPPRTGSTIPAASNNTLQGIYANSTMLLASNFGIAASNSAAVNDTGFAALNAAMVANSAITWRVIFAPGTYLYTVNRWLWGVQNVIIDAYGVTFQCTYSANDSYGNGIPLNVGDFFNAGGDVDNSTTFTDGYLINTATAGATSVTTLTAPDAGNFTPGMQVIVYGYDQQGAGYPPNMRYFDYMTVKSVNASTGVVTFTDQLKNLYDSRWWDTPNYAGTRQSYGAPRILSLQRSDYSIAQLIWVQGATFLANPTTAASYDLQLTAQLLIYDDVTAIGFNTGQTNYNLIRNSQFIGNQSSGDKLVNRLVIQDSILNPNPGYFNSLVDCVGCNSLSLIRDTFYGAITVSPRSLSIDNSDIFPNPNGLNNYSAIGSSNEPVWSLTIANTRVHNTGGISYGFTNEASPGYSLTVGSVSGTNIILPWNSTTETNAYQIDYGMTLRNSVTGNTGTITGIYYRSANGGELIITGTWSAPRAKDVMYYYSILNKYDQGGNAIVGTQVPFWRSPPVLAPPLDNTTTSSSPASQSN